MLFVKCALVKFFFVLLAGGKQLITVLKGMGKFSVVLLYSLVI